MSLDEGKIRKIEKTQHDNDSYCFENHTCIDCEYEKTYFDEDQCVVCIEKSKNNRICKWKPKSKVEN